MPTPPQFVADGVFYAELNELLMRELSEDGYAGVEVRITPMRTEIIIRATRTQNVLGELRLRHSLPSIYPPPAFSLYSSVVSIPRMGH